MAASSCRAFSLKPFDSGHATVTGVPSQASTMSG
jgi:hypothetical protein